VEWSEGEERRGEERRGEERGGKWTSLLTRGETFCNSKPTANAPANRKKIASEPSHEISEALTPRCSR